MAGFGCGLLEVSQHVFVVALQLPNARNTSLHMQAPNLYPGRGAKVAPLRGVLLVRRVPQFPTRTTSHADFADGRACSSGYPDDRHASSMLAVWFTALLLFMRDARAVINLLVSAFQLHYVSGTPVCTIVKDIQTHASKAKRKGMSYLCPDNYRVDRQCGGKSKRFSSGTRDSRALVITGISIICSMCS